MDLDIIYKMTPLMIFNQPTKIKNSILNYINLEFGISCFEKDQLEMTIEEILEERYFQEYKNTSQIFFPNDIVRIYLNRYLERRSLKTRKCHFCSTPINKGTFYNYISPLFYNETQRQTFVLKKPIIARTDCLHKIPLKIIQFESFFDKIANHTHESIDGIEFAKNYNDQLFFKTI